MGAGREQLLASGNVWPVADLADRPDGFEQTAAIMQNLDLVICSDSSPAHLAGALGVPVWVALSHAADWRWLLGREDCPWYPTMRLFRQPRRGDWISVFQRMEAELRRLVSTRDEGDLSQAHPSW
jgi:ADP-heptose:LPS heptosyltransferase